MRPSRNFKLLWLIAVIAIGAALLLSITVPSPLCA